MRSCVWSEVFIKIDSRTKFLQITKKNSQQIDVIIICSNSCDGLTKKFVKRRKLKVLQLSDYMGNDAFSVENWFLEMCSLGIFYLKAIF